MCKTQADDMVWGRGPRTAIWSCSISILYKGKNRMQVSICEFPLYDHRPWGCHAQQIHTGLLTLVASRSRRKRGKMVVFLLITAVHVSVVVICVCAL